MTHLIPLADALTPVRDVYAHLLSAAERWQEGRDRPLPRRRAAKR